MTAGSFPIRSRAATHGHSFVVWLSRAVLFLPMVILILIGVRCIGDPVHAFAHSGVALSTPEAFTDARVVGGITWTLAFVIGTSMRSLRRGHATVVVLMFLVLAIRVFGFLHDGTTLAMGDQKMKTIGEIVLLILNGIALMFQARLNPFRGVRP